jgi:hypothetical protein
MMMHSNQNYSNSKKPSADLVFAPTLAPTVCLRGLTPKLRHDHRPEGMPKGAAYVDPFARSWLGFSTTDPAAFYF